MKRLAHLNALRAFEIAARAGSFAKAAEELCVTPAAVSQQVRSLEAYLGVVLFHRLGTRLGPTPEALRMLPDISQGFERLSSAFARLAAPGNSAARRVRLAAPPAFVAKWLVPRLHRFRSKHPDIDLSIDSRSDNVDLARGEHHIQIRHSGDAEDALRSSRPLFTDELFPVCSPLLVTELQPSVGIRQLGERRLIHDDGKEFGVHPTDWAGFMRSFDVPMVANVSRSLHFGDSLSATMAAREGFGVLLARHFVVQDDLRSGALVRPFQGIAVSGRTYHAVYLASGASHEGVVELRDWLQSEGANYRDELRLDRTSPGS